MDINLNYKIENEKKIHQYLQSLDDTRGAAFAEREKSTINDVSPAVSKVNIQLKEVITQLQSAQNEITKNQILLNGLNRAQALLLQGAGADSGQFSAQINSIISETKFNSEPLLSALSGPVKNGSLEFLAKEIANLSKSANEAISEQTGRITKSYISLENVMASDSEIPAGSSASLNDVLMKIKNDLLKTGTQTQQNINPASVFELTK